MKNSNTTPGAKTFEHGQIIITLGVDDFINQDQKKADYIHEIINRHLRGDFGDLCEEDIETNLEAIENGFRIISAYEYSKDFDFYIITEADRSVTTILLKSEY